MKRFVGPVLAMQLVLSSPSFILAQSSQKLPEDAQKIVNSLPGKAVSLDLVVALAMKNSDAFVATNAPLIAQEVPKLQAQQAFAPKLRGSYSKINDESESTGGFAPDSAEVEAWEVGVTKAFPTGTQLDVEYSNNNNDLVFGNLGALPPGVTPLSNFSEAQLSLSLTQSLVKDFLGSSSQKRLKAADLQSKALGLQHKESLNDWHSSLVQVFYAAWLAQQQYEVATQNLAAQKRVLNVTRVQARRGTAETRQLLQIQGAETSANYQVTTAEQDLWDIWRNLIETLKLPKAWAKIHPSLVPMQLEEAPERVNKVCETVLAQNAVPEKSPSVERAEAQLQALDLLVEADKKQLGPEAFFRADLASNGISQSSADDARTETLSGDHPRWGVTLGFTWALGQQAEKAQLLQNMAQKISTQAQLSMAKGQARTTWVNGCQNIQRLKTQVQQLSEIVQSQERRIKLEERDFGIGRLPVLNVLQAILDLNQAKLNHVAAKAQLRQQAWQLFRLTGELPEYLKDLAQKNYSLEVGDE